MKNKHLKLLFFALFCAVWPSSVSAEMLRPAIANQNLTTFQKTSNFHCSIGQEIIQCQKKVFEKSLSPLGTSRKAGEGAGTAAIFFLALGMIIFGLLGLVILASAILEPYFWADGIQAIVTFSLVLLTLSVLCARGLIRKIKKRNRLKSGQTTPEELPRRPPSKKMEH